jgi:hypothetical protein
VAAGRGRDAEEDRLGIPRVACLDPSGSGLFAHLSYSGAIEEGGDHRD